MGVPRPHVDGPTTRFHFRLDEADGAAVDEVAGYTLAEDGLTFGEAGQIGVGRTFERQPNPGTSWRGSRLFGNHGNLNGLVHFTAGLWMRLDVVPGFLEAAYFLDINGNNFRLAYQYNGTLYVALRGSFVGAPALPLTLGKWAFVCVVREGTSLRVFKDGVRVSTLSCDGGPLGASLAMELGNPYVPPLAAYRGALDDVWLEARALSDEEVYDEYERGAGLMASEPVPGWDTRVLVVAESSFGLVPDPAAAQGLETVSCDMGPAELGAIRPKKDKAWGRAMQSHFIEGRVEPIPFSLETAVKARALATTVAKEAALYKAGGLIETVGGSSVVYSLSQAPVIPTVSILRALGNPALEAEQGRGGVVKSLEWSMGDAELMLKASGAFVGKRHLGSIESVTLDNVQTSVTVPTDEAYRLSTGYYLCETEILEVTAINYATGALTLERAQLSTVAAGHTAKPLYPYCPAITATDNPVSEANLAVTLDGDVYRCTKATVTLETGVDFLPGESGSRYRQGVKVTRFQVKAQVSLVLKREDVGLLGRVTQKRALAVSIVAGSGAGSLFTFALPYAELDAFAVPDPPNDVSVVDVSIRARDSEDSAGNDAFTLTCA